MAEYQEAKRELKILKKVEQELQEYYYLLRIVRCDLEKMLSNFSLAADVFESQAEADQSSGKHKASS